MHEKRHPNSSTKCHSTLGDAAQSEHLDHDDATAGDGQRVVRLRATRAMYRGMGFPVESCLKRFSPDDPELKNFGKLPELEETQAISLHVRTPDGKT